MVVEALSKDARHKLLESAVKLIRMRGYSATSVDQLCRDAGVTKGAFFHHFHSKDDLAVAAADFWSETTGTLFAEAPYHQAADPLDRVLAYIDFRLQLLQGNVCQFTCLIGTLVQEAYDSHPDIRAACERSIFGHAATLEADIAQAIAQRGLKPDWTAASLAIHTQTVLQGAFVLAKAQNSPVIAIESARHLRRYVELLFCQNSQTGE